MPTDFSVVPEIAQLAAPFVPPQQDGPRPATAGRHAAALTRLAVAPERWWDLVRFDPSGPVRLPVPGVQGAWLLVVPPGGAVGCDCAYATLIAGEAAENGHPLRPGRVLLHGGGAHRVTGAENGYSVSLHSLF